MNCHGNHNKKNQEKKNKTAKHMIMMILMCIIPIVLLVVLPYLNIQNRGIYSILSMGIFLLCPLMHGLMMFGMMRKSKKDKE